MFIRKARKTDRTTGATYVYHQLVESYRTPSGPRQRIVLNLGRLDLDPRQCRVLARRIEELLKGECRLFDVSQKIESLARHFASLLRKQRLETGSVAPRESKGHWERVDLDTVAVQDVRTVGAEAVGAWAFETLGLDKMLQEAGFGEKDVARAKVLILGKLIQPGSEREIHGWFHSRSALGEMMGIAAEEVSLTSLYRTSDRLMEQKAFIEGALVQRERALFGLGEKLILFDLTNTYFEGNPVAVEAQRGASKEKRTDRPLVTLALVMDEEGFAKWSKVFPGNVSEPATLKTVLDEMLTYCPRQLSLTGQRPTVVFDAGIATEANLEMVRARGLDYVCVDRRRVKEVPEGDEGQVHEGPSGTVSALRGESSGEVFLSCTSTGRQRKEEAIRSRFQKRFEQDLQRVAEALKKKGGVRKYEKVLERLGRLKEKYSPIAHFYEIHVVEKNGIVQELSWNIKDEPALQARFSGRYRLRSSRTDLSDQELWHLYNMLTHVEASFRSLKDELSLRPVYHRVSRRIQGHVFLTVLAYHLLCVIQRALHKKGLRYHWSTLRHHLHGQVRVTTTMLNDKGQVIHIRHTSEPEPIHVTVYRALGLSLRPLKTVKKIE